MPHGELKAACDALNAMAVEALVACPTAATAQPVAAEAGSANDGTGTSEG